MQWAAVVAVALLAAVCAVHAQDPDQCGTWNDVCKPVGDGGDYVNNQFTFLSISTGFVSYTREVFSNSTTCNEANRTLNIFATGTWYDYGVSSVKQGARQIIFSFPMIKVTPYSDDLVTQLTQLCPCANSPGAWSKGNTRNLTSCNGDCDTGFLGISAGDKQLEIGQPAYGSSFVDATGLSLTLLSADSTAGFAEPFENTSMVLPLDSGCENMRTSDFFCGQSVLDCAPVYGLNPNVGSETLEFDYVQSHNETQADDAAIVRITRKYYSDSMCQNAALRVVQEGTLIRQPAEHVQNAAFVTFFPAATSIVPLTNKMATQLRTDCPCGNTEYLMDFPVAIPYCNNDCPNPWFAGGFGERLYSTVQIRVNSQGSNAEVGLFDNYELRFTPLTDNETYAKTLQFSPSDYGLAYYENSCPTVEISPRMCGNWTVDCTHDISFITSRDYTSSISISTDGNVTGGRLYRSMSYFKSGYVCADEQRLITINTDGFWAFQGISLDPAGARKLSVNVPKLDAVVYDTQILNDFNQHCPCGQPWKLGKWRTITSCSDKTCPNPSVLCLGDPSCKAGSLGSAGFGLARVLRDDGAPALIYDEWLTVSDFENSNAGFDDGFELDDVPHLRTAACSLPIAHDVVPCGKWEQPCYNEPTTNNDFRQTFTLLRDDSYHWNATYYVATSSCASSGAVLKINQVGQFLRSYKTTPAVVGGVPFAITPNYIEVTPLTADEATTLKTQCPCGGVTWAPGKTVRITSPCNCNAYWLHQPIGKSGYGATIVEGTGFQSNFRLTTLQDTPASGAKAKLTSHDYPFFLSDDVCAVPSKSKSKGIDTGGILLLVFFFSLFAYFAVGMLLNYRSSGSPVIPHAEFWRGLPSLIWEGINFSICGCFGLRGSGVRYQKATFDSAGGTSGYGSL